MILHTKHAEHQDFIVEDEHGAHFEPDTDYKK